MGVLLSRYQVGIPRRQSARWSASGTSGMSAATDEDKNNIEGMERRGARGAGGRKAEVTDYFIQGSTGLMHPRGKNA